MNVAVPKEAIIAGPHLNWRHIDGPFMSWAGNLHWLTWWDRLRIQLHLASPDEIACERWPHLAALRENLKNKS